jgi:hypothetical protein
MLSPSKSAETKPFDEMRGAAPPRRGGAALTWYGTLLAQSKSEKCAVPPSPAAGEGLRIAEQSHLRGIAEQCPESAKDLKLLDIEHRKR